MGGYNERMLMNSYKNYSRDETVAKLVGVLRDLKREMGVITSERDEALYNLKKRSKENYEDVYRKIKRLYDSQVIVNNNLIKKNKELKKENKFLIETNKELRKSLNYV